MIFSYAVSHSIVGRDKGGSHGENVSDCGAFEGHGRTKVVHSHVLIITAVLGPVDAHLGHLVRLIGAVHLLCDVTTSHVYVVSIGILLVTWVRVVARDLLW